MHFLELDLVYPKCDKNNYIGPHLPKYIYIYIYVCLYVNPSPSPSPSLNSFAFRSSEVRRLLLDLDPYASDHPCLFESSDPLGMFPPFLKRTADVLHGPPT